HHDQRDRYRGRQRRRHLPVSIATEDGRVVNRGVQVLFRAIVAILAGAWITTASAVHAQWRTQSFTLQPGWNAVFLEVQPEPRDPSAVFSGIPVESVWMWNRKFSPVQFIQDATTLVPTQLDWLHYFPAGSDAATATERRCVESCRDGSTCNSTTGKC